MITNGENGFLVPSNDPDYLSKKIAYCLDNPKDMKKIRENARRSIIERFDMNKVYTERLDHMEGLLEST